MIIVRSNHTCLPGKLDKIWYTVVNYKVDIGSTWFTEKRRFVMQRLPGRCPHCGGTYTLDEGVNKCLMCSRKVTRKPEKAAYYEYNREAILVDVKLIGRAATRGKWGIPQGSMSRLMKRWLNKNGSVPTPAKEPSIDGTWPLLPAFSSSWDTEVQLRWLDVYSEIMLSAKKEAIPHEQDAKG